MKGFGEYFDRDVHFDTWRTCCLKNLKSDSSTNDSSLTWRGLAVSADTKNSSKKGRDAADDLGGGSVFLTVTEQRTWIEKLCLLAGVQLSCMIVTKHLNEYTFRCPFYTEIFNKNVSMITTRLLYQVFFPTITVFLKTSIDAIIHQTFDRISLPDKCIASTAFQLCIHAATSIFK